MLSLFHTRQRAHGAVPVAHGARRSRRAHLSATTVRGRARRQQGNATPEALQEVEEADHEVESDEEQDQENPMDLGRSAYDMARAERAQDREDQELAEEERIRKAQVGD
jgi:hypothetical protein